jgi:hypothetical protein
MKRPARDGDEQDAFSSWSRVMIWRPGERKAIKQRANRRDRRTSRQALRNGREG